MRGLGRVRAVTVSFATVVLLAGVGLPASAAEDGGSGKGGPSTPGVVVLVNEPGQAGAPFRLTATAHTSADAVPTANLVLRTGGLVVRQYEAHRVAVGDDGCGGGHGEDMAATAEAEGTRALIRGVGVLAGAWEGLAAGTAVQVWIDLKDVGPGTSVDQARVRVRMSPHATEAMTLAAEAEGEGCGSGKPWIYDSTWVVVQQVQVHVLGYAA